MMILLPLITEFEREDFDRIVFYAENGGRVYMIGATSTELFRRLLGGGISNTRMRKFLSAATASTFLLPRELNVFDMYLIQK